jgi:adenosine deaminase
VLPVQQLPHGRDQARAPHPIQRFLEAGVPVAICCDNTTVSRTDQVRESLQAAEQIGVEAVEAVHRAAAAYTFIRPELALKDADHDI